ncbi:hypothetical protein C2G38_2156917 [Gigaspora rosea]|uniref:Uncharacterized protein n=1 Tax=Gigaspora rosea TaxID=44941 RepID=A0A397W421_9GLOM|nr:hypothetical protein C2G38_2156917 [Gigaspora rosea]
MNENTPTDQCRVLLTRGILKTEVRRELEGCGLGNRTINHILLLWLEEWISSFQTKIWKERYLFDIVEKDTNKKFEFQHIYSRWLGCIIADEHQGQALGLGKYLHSKYCHLSSEKHLKHIYKLCQIHFNHNIRNKAISNETKELMCLIIKLNTQEEIYMY